ncbi:MAG TPA: 4Fe-4S binding protein [Syntrophales bacterium]|nr:4Fe-4S binding protein [Syntrophales bacterium]
MPHDKESKMGLYEKFREILDVHPSGAPKSKAFDEILRTLFAPEDLSLLVHMNFSPKPLGAIAAAAGVPAGKAGKRLEALADRALVFARKKGEESMFGLLPTIPGLFEFPFMKGSLTPELARLGKLWDEYHRDGLCESFAGNPTPVARVVPVEKSLDVLLRVHPYEEVKNLIEEADFAAAGECACRVSMRKCSKPTDTCLFFDAPARFLVERGYARKVSLEEARAILDRSEKAGLVHTSTNSADKAGFICNCCPCCCVILKGRTELNIPHPFTPSGFQAKIDADACTGCGICSDERCPMGAIAVDGDTAVLTEEKCIGCGLCVTGCPVEAVSLVRREAPPEVPSTNREMLEKVLTEKGKAGKFMKLMKS